MVLRLIYPVPPMEPKREYPTNAFDQPADGDWPQNTCYRFPTCFCGRNSWDSLCDMLCAPEIGTGYRLIKGQSNPDRATSKRLG